MSDVSRMRGADLPAAGTLGLRSRPLRAALSALGIAIGVASIVAVLGVTRSSQAALLEKIDRLGTNLLTVADGKEIGDEAPLPVNASRMIRRLPGVEHVAPTTVGTAPHQGREDIAFAEGEHVQPVHAGHHQVEQHHRRPQRAYQRQGLLSGGALAGHLDAVHLLQDEAQALPHHLVVIHDQHPDHRAFT